MIPRVLSNYVAEYTVTLAGTCIAVMAQLSDNTNGIPTVVSMGSVVAVLLWMQHARDIRLAEERKKEQDTNEARERRLQSRIESLEEQHSNQFATLASKQNECAVRQLEATVRNEQMMKKVESTLGEFNSALQIFVQGRPCLLERMKESSKDVQTTETITFRNPGESSDAE